MIRIGFWEFLTIITYSIPPSPILIIKAPTVNPKKLETGIRPKSAGIPYIWEFPKIRGTLFWGPYNKDPIISGTILGSPIFGNSHILLLGIEAIGFPTFGLLL